MEVRYYLKRPKDATSTVFARICYEGLQLKYYLSENLPTAYWDATSQRALKDNKAFPEYPEFNARLDILEHTIKMVFRKYRNDHDQRIPEPAELKGILDIATGKKVVKQVTFFSYYEDFNSRSEKGERISPKTKQKTSPNTNKGYLTTLNHLKAFQQQYSRKVDFATIDIRFHSDYISYLTSTVKLSINTIGDHIKRIITVMGEAKSRGIEVCNDFESSYFFKPHEETDSIYLNEAELKLIEGLDLSGNAKLARVRDMFLIGCYTGLRFSDYSVLRREHIKDDLIEIRQAKTSNKVVIPVHPVVKAILEKYDYSLPRAISNQKMNDYLKDIGKQLPELEAQITLTYTKGGNKIIQSYPKWALISTHTARRSFATNEYLAGTPVVTIMAITGHRTEKAFLRYIKLTSTEHAKLLKMHWEKRNLLRVV
ncbi:site-specific integrase [Chitinophaga oryzae]|uniref:Site-specific integrase n=1 Tax=Chitinophaga oryzae TaxID=2725414 RepID=A0AAE6ZJW4_9BACT|nr:site-specific integrase [Chitinophaga oryzae]QJB34079.1 site-specific integrase [Chitinophaga oryzae]